VNVYGYSSRTSVPRCHVYCQTYILDFKSYTDNYTPYHYYYPPMLRAMLFVQLSAVLYAVTYARSQSSTSASRRSTTKSTTQETLSRHGEARMEHFDPLSRLYAFLMDRSLVFPQLPGGCGHCTGRDLETPGPFVESTRAWEQD